MACADGFCKVVRYLSREEKRKEYDHDMENAREPWQDLRNDMIRIGHQYSDHTTGITNIGESLHDAWDELIHAAKIIPSASSEHDP
ncbi:hypothetical protein QBC33DRAFT_563165 [Phialemonium atrogriseum]|uniref:Uncharacterized protein n=1 Tax=Phialemonium atrogriseum TaxID=1093897 RepID=A0AAJ0FJJ3_9PEZI|nr:uncharacterized protein QBC33DRAFT_563165 [Phialemonium atrogriseum]KAK1763170.1 hypothetical protein QBC33DRAFT_563165 [Phialemonium atrogriseum]